MTTQEAERRDMRAMTTVAALYVDPRGVCAFRDVLLALARSARHDP